ncbi:MAG: TfuA-like protein [Alsobacter sp.]
MSMVLFLGPSLSAEEAIASLATAGAGDGVVILPPATQGDVYRAVRDHRPAVIGLVDGYFHQVPAVWHKEILWAMASGVTVCGAASMGALRAAELHAFGMIGIGRIFEAYGTGRFAPFDDPFENDDEVAVLHGPPETGYLRLSEALVDIRRGLADAEAAGLVDGAGRDALLAAAAALPFGERCLDAMLAAAGAAAGPDVRQALRDWWHHHAVSQKREDALALVVAAHAASARTGVAGGTPPVSFRFQRSGVWEAFVRAEEAGQAESLSADEARAVAALQRDPLRWADACRIAARAAKGPADARAAFEAWRASRGLRTGPDLADWMVDNRLDDAGLTLLFARAVQRSGAGATAAALRDIVDHLRLTDGFATLHERALHEEEILAGLPHAATPPSADTLATIAARYGLMATGLAAEPVAAVAKRLCYPDTASFVAALWARYCLDEAGAGSDRMATDAGGQP